MSGTFCQSKVKIQEMEHESSNTGGRLPADVIRQALARGRPLFWPDGVKAPTRPRNRRTSEAGVSPRRPLDTVNLNLKRELPVSVFLLAEVTVVLLTR